MTNETKVDGVTLGGSVSGTGLAGYLTASYRDLVRLLGEPNGEGDGYKVSTIWKLAYKGQTYTLYEYKETALYGDTNKTVAEFRALTSYEWHVGAKGDCAAFVTRMREALSKLPPLLGKKTVIVTIVHTESTHYEVEMDEADSNDEAIEKAKEAWTEGPTPGVREISLGSEFADIDRAYVDADQEEKT